MRNLLQEVRAHLSIPQGYVSGLTLVSYHLLGGFSGVLWENTGRRVRPPQSRRSRKVKNAKGATERAPWISREEDMIGAEIAKRPTNSSRCK